MGNFKVNKNLIKNNNGSTLITVIVAIAFVTILTGMILGTSFVNLKMKGIDRLTKDDFYYAEKSLGDIYTGIGQVMSQIAGEEYDKAFSKAGSDGYEQAEKAETEYREQFVTRAFGYFKTDSDDLKAQLQDFILSDSRGNVDSVGAVVKETKDGKTNRIRIKNVQVSTTDASGYHAVVSTDIVINIPSASFLGANVDVTDYGIIANKGLYIDGGASGGIVKINGNVYAGIHDPSEYTTEDKAVYDDIDIDYNSAGLYGGVNVIDSDVTLKGNYIVSKGDINITGANSKLTVGTPIVSGAPQAANLPNIWFSSLRTLKGVSGTTTVSLNANTFALNDLELNGNDSEVTISGNYYGYNDKTLPMADDIANGIKYSIDQTDILNTKKREDTESSAIIVNGKHCKLNMKDVKTFVLMGKAYVDFTANGNTVDTSGVYAKEIVPTAEGVALKTNQQLYLVPFEMLNCANPILADEFGGTFDVSPSKSSMVNWFGYKYVRPAGVVDTSDKTNDDDRNDTSADKKEDGTQSDTEYKNFFTVYKVTKTTTGETVYYAYLKFNDIKWKETSPGHFEMAADQTETLGTGGTVSSMAAFFGEIMAATGDDGTTQPCAYRMKERIEGSMNNTNNFNLQECVIGSGASSAVLYATNAVVSYERDSSTGKIQSNLLENTDGMYRFSKYPQNLFHRYQDLCLRLNGNEDVDLDKDPFKKSDGVGGFIDIGPITAGDVWQISRGYEADGSYNPSTGDADDAPLSHFVLLKTEVIGTGVDTSTTAKKQEANSKINRAAYGDCVVVDGDLDIDSTFKGVAIVNGDITVDNCNVYGLLMATGTITIKGNSTINCDKGLIQSRIEKELQLAKESPASDRYKDYYLIKYLAKDTRIAGSDGERLYKVDGAAVEKTDYFEADYNVFVQYENWKKGKR